MRLRHSTRYMCLECLKVFYIRARIPTPSTQRSICALFSFPLFLSPALPLSLALSLCVLQCSFCIPSNLDEMMNENTEIGVILTALFSSKKKREKKNKILVIAFRSSLQIPLYKILSFESVSALFTRLYTLFSFPLVSFFIYFTLPRR